MTKTDLAGLDDSLRALMTRYLAIPEDLRPEPLTDIAEKVTDFGSFASAKQRGFFMRLLGQAENQARDEGRLGTVQGDENETPEPDASPTLGEYPKVEAEMSALRSTNASLEALAKALRAERDEARADFALMRKQADSLQAELNTLRALTKNGPALTLDVAKRLAKSTGEQVEKGILAVLQGGIEEHASKVMAKAQEPAKPTNGVRPLDLDPVPAPKAGLVLTNGAQTVKVDGPIPLQSIVLTRAEGKTEECVTVTLKSWNEAETTLRAWAKTAPANGGYDKCDFKVTWTDGEDYDGRFDLTRTGEDGSFSVKAHMVRHLTFVAGRFCPSHMKKDEYVKLTGARYAGVERAQADQMLALYLGEPLPPLVTVPAPAPKPVPTPAQSAPTQAKKLAKCPKCKAYILGEHSCK